MKLLNLLFCLAYGGDFHQRRRFHGFHTKRFIKSAQFNNDKSEMPGRPEEVDPKLQSLIDFMITDRRKTSIGDFSVWNLYRKNLNT